MTARSTIKLALPIALLGLSACDSFVNGNAAAVSVTQQAFSDSASLWEDLFTYHEPAKPQAPQTRYCYRMMADIVCYDSLQPTLTAKLVGYQDGTHVSWVQPGGGSLGASGGEPIAYQPQVAGRSAKPDVYAVQTPVEYTPVYREDPNSRTTEIQKITVTPH